MLSGHGDFCVLSLLYLGTSKNLTGFILSFPRFLNNVRLFPAFHPSSFHMWKEEKCSQKMFHFGEHRIHAFYITTNSDDIRNVNSDKKLSEFLPF